MKYNKTITLNIREIADLKEGKKSLEDILNKSYSHKPHLASLPHDRRTNDPEKLKERLDEVVHRLEETKKKEIELVKERTPWEEELEKIENELSSIKEDEELHKQNYKDSQKVLQETFEKLNPLIDEIREEEGYYESGPQSWGEADPRIYDYLDAVNELGDIANIDVDGGSNKTSYELINEKFKKSKLYELLDDDEKDFTLSAAVNKLGRIIQTEHNPQNPTLNSLLKELGGEVEEMGNYDGIKERYGEVSDMMDFEYSAKMYGMDRSDSNVKKLNSNKEKLENKIERSNKEMQKLIREEEDYHGEMMRTGAKLNDVKDKMGKD